MRFLQGQPLEIPQKVRIRPPLSPEGSNLKMLSLPHHDHFRLAKKQQDSEIAEVEIIAKQGASLMRPLLEADCWVLIPGGSDKSLGYAFESLPLHPTS